MGRPIGRRSLLFSTVAMMAPSGAVAARTVRGSLPFSPGANSAPIQVRPGPWTFFTPEEGAAIEVMVDRIIPADSRTPGGKDAGCAVFIDRQLAGPWGRADGLYMRPPFADGLATQGLQSPLTPAARYRQALAALAAYCRGAYPGKAMADLPPAELDRLLTGLEKGGVKLDGADGRAFFELLLGNTMEGFFADPVYGGNRDMAGWRMLGFPGARYDFRDWIGRHGETYPLPPVGIAGRPEWTKEG